MSGQARLGPAPMEMVDCGTGRCWVSEGSTVDLLEADEALLLQALDGFWPVDAHAAALRRAGFDELEPGDLARRLEELRDLGLMVSDAELVERLARGPETSARIGWTAWVTRERPALVVRSLQSWLACHGKSELPRLAVLDDSEDEQTRAALASLSEPLWYAGRQEKRRFAERLAAGGIPPAVLELALSPPPGLGTPYGANRNALLLATAGEAVISSDDDVLFEPATIPRAAGGLAISSDLDPAGVRYHGDRGRLLESLDRHAALPTPVAAHEAFLGRGVAECARLAAGALELGALHRGLALRLARAPHRVLLTASGLYGDSGLRGRTLLHLQADSWQAVAQSAETYELARESREVVRCVAQPTLCECGYLVGQCFGLDNRELLPPFFPVGRREDGIFAATLRVTHPLALTAHLPLAVLHDPVPPPGRAAETDPPPQPLFADILSLLITACPPGRAKREAETRMQDLASHLRGMSSLEARDLESWVRQRWARRWASEMALCEQRLRESAGDEPWVRDAAARRAQVVGHIEAGGAVHPRDLGGGEADASWQQARSLLRGFAELLHWWPAVVAASRELQRSGHGLLEPLHRA